MKLIRAGLLIIPIFISARTSQAQPSSIQQLQNSQLNALQQLPLPALRGNTNAPELYPGENTDVGPQEILRKNQRLTYFEAFLDSEVYFSDNPTYAPTPNRTQSFVYVNTIQAAFVPPPFQVGDGKLAPTVGYVSQWYDYGNAKLLTLDFDAQTAFAGLKYSVGKWVATANFNFTSLLNQENYNKTYQELLPSLSLQRYFVLNDKMLVAVGDQLDYHITDAAPYNPLGLSGTNFVNQTDLNDRLDEVVFVTFNWQITSQLALQPFYRFQYSYYRRNSINTENREDTLNACGLTVIYTFNKYISARAFANYNLMHSTDPGNLSYNEINGGVGASLDVKF